MKPNVETRQVGLARALSKLGFCSRSRAAELIREGRVRLNGAARRNPQAPVRLDRDRVEVDGKPVAAETKTYLILNKPRGVVTTASDEKGRQTVYSLLDKDLPWVGPVGRLDKASEGLLLLTNDSEWAAKISDPATHLYKTYHVQITTHEGATLAEQFARGVSSRGELLRAQRARVVRAGEKNTWLEIVLDEGQNRQIRRLVEASGHEVLRLVRVAIGPLRLGALAKGSFRLLTTDEKAELDRSLENPRQEKLFD